MANSLQNKHTKIDPGRKINFNGLQFVKESEPEIKALLRKTPHPKTSLMNSTEHLIRNENMMSTIHHTFQKTEEEEHLSVVSWGSYDPDTTAWEALQKRDCRPTRLLSAGTDITDKTPPKAAIYEDSDLPWPSARQSRGAGRYEMIPCKSIWKSHSVWVVTFHRLYEDCNLPWPDVGQSRGAGLAWNGSMLF